MGTDKDFKLGEQVMLISGSPRMTIVERTQPGCNVLCGWFTKEGEYRKEFFDRGAIRRVIDFDVKQHRSQGVGW